MAPPRALPTPSFLDPLHRFLSRSYLPDYFSLLTLIVLNTLIGLFLSPFHRLFLLSDLSKSYPHTLHQRVPELYNILLAGVSPFVLLLLWSLVARPGWHKAHVTILGFAISLALTSFLTDVVKNAVGRPRPDLIARCKPRPGTPADTWVGVGVCTETDQHRLHDGWRSFPSGHSSFSFSGLGYLSLWLAGQFGIFRPQHSHLAGVLVAAAPSLGAALVAVSRLEDYRHDVWDVSAGSALGIGIAWFSYRRYYPKLRGMGCETPYPSRAEVERKRMMGVKKDEEIGRNGRLEEEDVEDFEIGSDEDGEESVPLHYVDGPGERDTGGGETAHRT